MSRFAGKHVWTNSVAGAVALGVILVLGQAARADSDPAQPFQHKGAVPVTLEGRLCEPAGRARLPRAGRHAALRL